MIFSRKAKEAIKTALAMTIAYGIALQMGWDKPVWAGFAVAFVSLTTVGQSFNKAALRTSGTLVATAVALMIIGVFPQDRWLFMMFLSAWVGYCTYMMGGVKYPYFWNVCGFVSVIVCVSGGPDAANAFRIAILRSQETGLGILVYSLVALLVWPTSSRAGFDAAAGKLASTQRRLYQAFLGQMSHRESDTGMPTLRAQLLQAQAQFGQLLEAAETDSYDIWEMRQQWREFQRLSADFTGTVAGWYENFIELQVLDIDNLLPNLKTFGAELGQRFAQIEHMLAGQAPEQQPVAVDLTLDEAGVESLTHFHRAALAVTRTRLLHLETLTRSLFNTVCVIRDFGPAGDVVAAAPPPRAGFVFDPDRMISVVRVMTTLWLAYLAVIYIPGIPGGFGLVNMAGPFGMMLAGSPQLPVRKLLMPITCGLLLGAVIHIFVMPQLSSFISLGLLIFAVTFGICYLFAAPKQVLSKLFGLAMFLSVANVVNQQTYSFLGVTTTALMFCVIFLLLGITVNIPFSARPEKTFLRLLCRYFRSCEYLMRSIHGDAKRRRTPFERWRKMYCVHEMSTLSAKLGVWARFINTKALPGTTAPQIQAVLTGLQALTYRMRELLNEYGAGQTHFLVQELQPDIKAWLERVEEIFQWLAGTHDVGDKETLHVRLAALIDHLEQRIAETLDRDVDKQATDRNREDFYRLLGAYRGVSEALVACAGNAGVVDWTLWNEEKF